MTTTYPINALQRGFEWFDEGLQKTLQVRGWPSLTRSESQIMVHVVSGVRRPADLARRLGVTRQAVHLTLKNIVKKGIFEVVRDQIHGNSNRIIITPFGKSMVREANSIVNEISAILSERIGKDIFNGLMTGLSAEWGKIIILDFDELTK